MKKYNKLATVTISLLPSGTQNFALFAAAFLVAFATGQYMLGLIFYTQDLFAATPKQVGVFSGLFALIYGICCAAFLFLPFYRHREEKFIVVASFAVCLIYAASLVATSLTHIYGLVALSGVVLSCFWPPLGSIVCHGLEGKALNRRISLFSTAWSSGGIVSTLVCGWLSEQNVALPLIMAVIGSALAAAMLFAHFHKKQFAPAHLMGQCARPAVAGMVEGQSTPYRFPAWAGLFSIYFCVGVTGAIFPAVARSELHFSESLIGLLLFFRALFLTIFFNVLGRFKFWQFQSRPLLGYVALTGVLMLVLGFSRSPLVIGVIYAVFGAVMAMSYTFSFFHGTSGASNRVARLAIHESLANFGVVCGVVIGGLICERYSIQSVYGVCTGLVLLTLLAQVFFLARIRRVAMEMPIN